MAFASFRSAMASFRLLARVPVLCVIAALAASIIAQQGWLVRIETALADHAAFTTKIAPQNRTLLVVVDEATIRQVGKYPYDRALVARALDIMNQGGARRVYLDASLNYPEEPAGDEALEAALGRLGPERAALPFTRVGADVNGPVYTQPLPRFAGKVTLVNTEFLYDPDRRVRRIMALPGETRPLTATWIAGSAPLASGAQLRINYAVDVHGLKHIGLLDVTEGRVPPEVFRDRPVVLGLKVAASQFLVAVPGYGTVSRVDLLALAVETIDSGRELLPLSFGQAFLLTLCIALAFAALVLRLGTLSGFAVWLLVLFSWFGSIETLQMMSGRALPNLPPPLAALVVWQGLKFRDSGLARGLGRLWMRFAGVGKSALIAAVDVVADPAMVFDAQGKVLGANEAFQALAVAHSGKGWSARTMTLAELFGDDAAPLLAHAGSKAAVRADLSVTAGAGAVPRHFEASVGWVETMTGRMAIASLKDVTEAREREVSLARLAFKDALTGLANRVAFHARLTAMGESGADFAVLLIDLDGFKQVNDTLGHHAGDLLLSGVARRFEALLRSRDMIARLGGDEFAILLATGAQSPVVDVAERLLSALREPFDLEGASARVGASIGIALYPAHHGDPHEVLKLADQAMYAAKRVKPAYALHSAEGAVPVSRRAA